MIEIDLDLIQNYNLTIEEYVMLDLLRLKHYNKIRKYFNNESNMISILDRLVLLGHLKRNDFDPPNVLGGYKIVVFPRRDPSFIDKLCIELIETYPLKVIRPDGSTDYLRSNVKVLKEQYKKIIKDNKDKHEFILKCLKFQIKEKTETGKLPYMKKLSKWLDNEEWKEYEDRVLTQDDTSSFQEEDNIYGRIIEG
jgi:hypothetical protein